MLKKECWIFGKGPSLDTFILTDLMMPRFAINEAAFIIPNCSAVCKDLLMVKIYEKSLPVRIPIYTKNFTRLRRLNAFTQYPSGKILAGHNYHNSIAMASVIAKSQGYIRQHFVGCDAIDGILNYADSIKKIVNRPPGHLIRGAKLLEQHLLTEGVEAIWEHRTLKI